MKVFNIEDKLRAYKKNKAEVNTTLQRIGVWKKMLEDGNIRDFVNTPASTLGMPRAPLRQGSCVESEYSEMEVTFDLVKQWIADEESRIFVKNLEVAQIDEALKALTAEQRYIIDRKCFEGWAWKTIEINFNEQFKHRGAVYERGLKYISREALDILADILTPFYEQFMSA